MNIEEVLEARETLRGVARPTPVVPSSFHPELYFKTENLQVTGSFKIRAAYNEIAHLQPAEQKRGVVTSSSGNFAQGTAYASKLLDVSAKIVMMQSSNPLKVERTRQWGAEVVFCEDRFEARAETVAQIQKEEGRVVIHSYDHPSVIAGNGTIALEILEQLPEVQNIVVPVSGGGLISGIAFTAKTRNPSVRIWGIQPSGSNAAYLSFQSKKIVSIDKARTIADGLIATQPGSLTFPLIARYVDDVVTVEEDSILRAVRHFLNVERLVVEPSGVVAMAAAFEDKAPLKKTVFVLSGGNISPDVLRRAVMA